MLSGCAEALTKGATMKTQLSAVLFALCVSACGGGQESTNSPTILSYIQRVPRPDTLSREAQPVGVNGADAGVGVKVEPVAAPRPIPTTYEDALAAGRRLVEQGDRLHARELFEAAVKLDKRHAEPHMELARLYIATGDKALAVSEAKKAIKLAPNSSSAWNTIGRAELGRFGYDAAIDAFTKSVELNRDNVWAWNNLGYTELVLKKYDEAVEHLTEATSRKGATGYMWNNLGTAFEQLDRLDDARHAFEEGSKLGSKEALASRTRLEGVKSIEFARMEKATKIEVKPGYEINEGQTDEDRSGSGTGAGLGSDTETH
jgi:tetratricopeptide (TPR) repeat protein